MGIIKLYFKIKLYKKEEKVMTINEWLNGRKTYIGGIGAILIGVGKYAYDWHMGSLMPIEEYLSWVVAGWTIMGFRSGIKKIA